MGGGLLFPIRANKNYVTSLQMLLINDGFLSNEQNSDGVYIQADGIYGPKTNLAYINWQNSKKKQHPLMSFRSIELHENSINLQSNTDIINYYHRTHPTNIPYIIDDKINNKLNVYINGNLIKSYQAIHGKNSASFNQTYLKKFKTDSGYEYKTTEIDPDEMTVTYVDEKGKLINLAGNLTTPAGIYFTTEAKQKYNGSPSFIRRTKLQVDLGSYAGISSSIHVRTITEGANTNGCTGISAKDAQDLSNLLKGYTNIPTYILPTNNKNKFKIRNGLLSFSSHDITKTPSFHTFNYDPIKKIKFSTANLNEHQISVLKLFSNGLIINKELIQKEFGINNDSYNKLAQIAVGILGVESNYGLLHSGFGNFLRAAAKAFSSNNSSPDIYSKYSTYGADSDSNSIGLTLIRFSYLSNRVKLLYKKYRITKDDLVYNPLKAALATMIKLADEFKNQGLNILKTVKSWNNRDNYYSRVMKASQRINIFLEYYK